jgi:hypothetical protein
MVKLLVENNILVEAFDEVDILAISASHRPLPPVFSKGCDKLKDKEANNHFGTIHLCRPDGDRTKVQTLLIFKDLFFGSRFWSR